MSARDDKTGVDRRRFLGAGAAASAGAAAAALGQGSQAKAQQAAAPPVLPAPTEAQLARDAGDVRPPEPDPGRAAIRPGSDLMVEVLRRLGVEYVATNPGSSFEALHESLINYGGVPNTTPELITCLHEESAVDMAHGYAKATGKPMIALLHGVLGLQHACMAIYQAYNNGVPVVIVAGRDNGFIQAHTADDMAGIVRHVTKWDSQPRTLQDALLDLQRACHIAMTPPCAPTLVVLDTELQKEEAGGLEAPVLAPEAIPAIDAAKAREIAQALVAAKAPRIAVGRLRTPEGVARAVELAELVAASTSTRAAQGPMSFPQRHALCGPGLGDADYVLGLEAPGEHVTIQGPHVREVAGRDPTGIGYGDIRAEGRALRPQDAAFDAEACLPAILEETRKLVDAKAKTAIAQRAEKIAAANHEARVAALEAALEKKRAGWDSSPVSLARIYAELWPHIKDLDWCLSSPAAFTGNHHADLWDNDKPYSYLGAQGAGGIGISIGSSVGAALAAKSRGRIVVDIQSDGDINYAPGSLWTAAHHRVPLLMVMHNNRAWHQELMFIQYMAGVRGRGAERAEIGTTLRDPFIDYAKLAAAYGVESEGPIDDPALLSAAFARGIEVVKQGRPYLIDVITQPR